KKREAGNDSVEQKEDRVELMIAFVARDRGSGQADEIERSTENIWWPLLEKMRDPLEQSVGNVDRAKECKDDEEGAVIRIKNAFVIQRRVDRAFAREKEQRSQIEDCWRD